MFKMKLFMGLVVVLVTGVSLWILLRVDVDMGRNLAHNNCGVCHDLTDKKQHRKGPYLWGVVGRPAGSAPNFRYSTHFIRFTQKQPFSWTEENLEKFIRSPNDFIPNSIMGVKKSRHMLSFEGVDSAEDRRDLLGYLKTMK